MISELFRHGIAPVSFGLVVSQTYADATVLSFGFSGSLWYHDRHNEVFMFVTSSMRAYVKCSRDSVREQAGQSCEFDFSNRKRGNWANNSPKLFCFRPSVHRPCNFGKIATSKSVCGSNLVVDDHGAKDTLPPKKYQLHKSSQGTDTLK